MEGVHDEKKDNEHPPLVFVLCTGILTGCNPFPLREEAKVTQPKTPGQMEDEAEHEEEDDGDVIAPDETPDGTVMYCSSAVNVRTMPSTQGAVIGELTAGQRVTVTGKESGWYEIVFGRRECLCIRGLSDRYKTRMREDNSYVKQ